MTRSGVRISGGKLRGRSLSVPATARPTSARLREALFDIWQARVSGARVVDLFAGTGAVGFEALSRGADFVVFVESDRGAVRRLQSACSELAPASSAVCLADLPSQMNRVLPVTGKNNDLIFADPPYDFEDYAELLASLLGLLKAGGEVAVEHSIRRSLPESVEGLERTDSRAYGENRVTFFSSAGSH
jgi:16S rRNA (guanine966-N2)-methyltransferase